MDLQKKAEKHFHDTYDGDSKLWDDEYDEANHKDVSCVGYIAGYQDAIRRLAEDIDTILVGVYAGADQTKLIVKVKSQTAKSLSGVTLRED